MVLFSCTIIRNVSARISIRPHRFRLNFSEPIQYFEAIRNEYRTPWYDHILSVFVCHFRFHSCELCILAIESLSLSISFICIYHVSNIKWVDVDVIFKISIFNPFSFCFCMFYTYKFVISLFSTEITIIGIFSILFIQKFHSGVQVHCILEGAQP